MSEKSTKIPVVVFGGSLTVLGVIRNLGNNRIPVYCAEYQDESTRQSRYYKPMPVLYDSKQDDFYEYLNNLDLPKAVILPCSDKSLQLASKMPESLKDRFLTSIPGSSVIPLFTDKEQFAQLNSRLGIPAPKSFSLDSLNDFEKIDREIFSHAFLKPVDSQGFGTFYKKKAVKVNSYNDAVKKYDEIDTSRFRMILQEYIPGEADDHYFIDGLVDKRGEIKAMFARRRIRMYPYDFGNSSFLRSITLDNIQQAVDSIEKIMSNIEYRGIYSAEFKFDHRDKQYKIIEINARAWWFNQFPARCGLDIISMNYYDALGENIKKSFDYKTGKGFVYALYDEPAAQKFIKEGKLSYLSLWTEWLFAYKAVFNLADPCPFWHNLSKRIKRKFLKQNDE